MKILKIVVSESIKKMENNNKLTNVVKLSIQRWLL